ncbi:hypothetical protein IB238_09245 [Rhizobium sp. ARZ01]|uniref:hypothetical protein n=1 Tax=Rhizobium sp. ARZ01 TaxID=2769313 RepID=UPI0017828F65|nr:hypothetical protein [Rhizobium sp. ARZ01]MBD9372803.1 hypothetical protein [Rhizobium sp. ARZ01]
MSHKYRAEQAIHISGLECGTEIELKMIVNFTVHKGCAQTLNQPAEPATAEVDEVRFFDGEDEIKLPWSIEDRITSRDEFKDWLLSEAAEDREYALEQAAEARSEERWLEDRA